MIVYRNQETIDILLEKAFCDGYEYAQKEYAKINLVAGLRNRAKKIVPKAKDLREKAKQEIKGRVKEFKDAFKTPQEKPSWFDLVPTKGNPNIRRVVPVYNK